MQAVAFWTITAEHCCIFEKLCKSLSVPKRNKMWVGRAHEASTCKEKKPKQNKRKRKHIAEMSTFVYLKEEYI